MIDYITYVIVPYYLVVYWPAINNLPLTFVLIYNMGTGKIDSIYSQILNFFFSGSSTWLSISCWLFWWQFLDSALHHGSILHHFNKETDTWLTINIWQILAGPILDKLLLLRYANNITLIVESSGVSKSSGLQHCLPFRKTVVQG